MSLKRNEYLTKSRYRMACECPTKLFYTKKSKEEPACIDNGIDDPFLEALRDGGFQVREMVNYWGSIS